MTTLYVCVFSSVQFLPIIFSFIRIGELIEYHRTLRFVQHATFIQEVPKLGISLHVRRQKLNTVRVLRRASACLSETRKTLYVRRACMPSVSLRSSQIPLIKCRSERRDRSQECPAEHVASRTDCSVKISPVGKPGKWAPEGRGLSND